MKKRTTYLRNFFKSRKRLILLIIILALIIFRLFLPMIVKNYVNKILANIPGYHGSVDDIDIALYRGAYVINGLQLFKNGVQKPMLDFPVSDISIQWSALFHGRIVSEIELYRPAFNIYIVPAKTVSKGKAAKDDWTQALHKLVPIKINRFYVENGKFLYSDIAESPDINLAIEQVQLTATNLGNVVDKSKPLPSAVDCRAVSFGKGNLGITAHMNMLKEIPDMDVNVSLRNSDVTALNEAAKATAGFDFEKGEFELFSEFAIKNGYLKGYFKPMFSKIVIIDRPDKKNSSFIKRVWESVITFFGYVLKNKPKDSFATKIPVEGNLKDPNVEIWPLITNIFRNAFITPFKKEVDNEINFNDASPKKK